MSKFIPLNNQLSSDDVLKGVSQWQETNDADGSWANFLEKEIEETEGTKIAAENREKCNKLTDEEREKHYQAGLKIIYGKEPK